MIASVFISGSISINKLPQKAIDKLDGIVQKGIMVLVGDAKGVDLQAQKYLLKKKHDNVVVYHVGNGARNNVGKWQTRRVPVGGDKKGRGFYAEKDKAMARDADYGLMIWDGRSEGTRNNMLNMREANKKFLVVMGDTLVSNTHIGRLLSIGETDAEAVQPTLF